MHYYYDLLVNLDEVAWEFYEWEKKDVILPIKKIPFLRINEKEFKEISAYEGKIEKNWLEPYIGKTQIKKDKSKNLLLSTTKNSLAIEINSTGQIISRSKLLIEDENNCNELASSLKETTIPFSSQQKIHLRSDFRQAIKEKNLIKIELKTLKETTIPFSSQQKIPLRSDFRQAIKEKNLIKIELKTLKETKNTTKCSYLYYEWFNILEDDLSTMLENCLEELKKPYTLKIHKIASLIRLSYKECL